MIYARVNIIMYVCVYMYVNTTYIMNMCEWESSGEKGCAIGNTTKMAKKKKVRHAKSFIK